MISATTMAALLLAMATASSLQAQATDPEEEDILVEGERIERGEARGQARDITARRGSWDEPLARFQRPICPGVWGLLPENAQAVIDRIYNNAERAGAAVNEDPECAANLWVIFVEDPRATFTELRNSGNRLTRNLAPAEARRLRGEDGPALAWNVTFIRTREGEIVGVSGDPPTLDIMQGNIGSGDVPMNTVSAMSRSNSAVRLDIEMSVVLIERSAIAAFDAYAIADYATMRALSRTREPGGGGRFATVLTLFEDGQDRLTDFDLAYLQDLYSSRATQPGRQGHGRIARLMNEARQSD